MEVEPELKILYEFVFLTRCVQVKKPMKEAIVSIEETYMSSTPIISSYRHGMQLKSGPAIPIVKWWQSMKLLAGSRDWCIISWPDISMLMTSPKIKNGVINKLLFQKDFEKPQCPRISLTWETKKPF